MTLLEFYFCNPLKIDFFCNALCNLFHCF
uniref:Uncharacterized protein n=1 Tax=Lepeophtheirus salmonis TaxID=72036 RepID=A0A0K2T542_LEPSM